MSELKLEEKDVVVKLMEIMRMPTGNYYLQFQIEGMEEASQRFGREFTTEEITGLVKKTREIE